jgi:hypothetical protein
VFYEFSNAFKKALQDRKKWGLMARKILLKNCHENNMANKDLER